MRGEDRIFLAQYASSICLTHPIAALALHRAAVDAQEVAIVAESGMHLIDREAAETKAIEGNTAALVQTHIVARLMAQLAAAIEDCGAIGEAIRYRDRSGLFRRYLKSAGAAVGEFWDLVLAPTPFTDLLALPAIESLSLSDEDEAALTYTYRELPRSLVEVAGIYRGKGSPGALSASGSLSADEADVVKVVVDIVASDGTTGTAQFPGVSLPEVYNKIKHRFAVFDRIVDFGAAAWVTGDRVIYATYPRDPGHAQTLLNNIFTVARVSGEMAALALTLDQLGVLPPGR
jgi:hypothetical protein